MVQPLAPLCTHGERGTGQTGRCRKHPGGWEQSIKRICISKATYSKWLVTKEEKSFINDDTVALYLLSLYTRSLARGKAI